MADFQDLRRGNIHHLEKCGKGVISRAIGKSIDEYLKGRQGVPFISSPFLTSPRKRGRRDDADGGAIEFLMLFIGSWDAFTLFSTRWINCCGRLAGKKVTPVAAAAASN